MFRQRTVGTPKHLPIHSASLKRHYKKPATWITGFHDKPDIAPTDMDLKLSILRDHRGLENMSDWNKVNVIRHWAAEHIVWSSFSCLLENDPSFNLYKQDASVIFNAFCHNLGGVMCGGAAYALMRLYRLFDYKSHLVNMGKPEYATHVVALVYINVDGKKVLSIQDALFDISYTTIDGHPMDYFEMLTNLRNLDHKQIKAVPSNKWEVQRSIIIKSNENAIYNWIEIPRQFVPLGEDRRLYRATMSFDLFGKVSTYAQSFKEFVARLGYPGNLLYIYLFPFQVDECTLENLISKSRCEGEEAGILEEALKIARGTVQ